MLSTEKSFLSVKEVAEDMGKSTNYVRKWIKAGVIPAYKIGHTNFIPVKAYNDWQSLESILNFTKGGENKSK